MDSKIYIVLSQSYTMLARVIKVVTKDKYSHVSISLDKECSDMYSIGRRFTYYPFSGVYKNESIYKGVFNRNKKAQILVYELDITSDQYDNIINLLDEYGKESKGYNFVGLLLAIFNKKIDRKKYYCSEFIYKVLSDDSVKIYPKTNGIVKPMDFEKIDNLKKVYEGKIIDYKNENDKVMV